MASSSNILKIVKYAAKTRNKDSTKTGKSGKSDGAGYHYEIDCVRVADSINVVDLVRATFRFKLLPP